MEYLLMQPPFEVKTFKEMSKKEAKAHFEWYISEIPTRIQLLKEAFEITGGGRRDDLDFSEDSLLKIWNWYINNAEVVEKATDELETEKSILSEWIRVKVGSNKISIGWMSIAMDISIYFAESIRSKFTNIQWGFVDKPKSLAYVNKPVLTGLKTGIGLDASNIVSNLTLKVADGEKNPEALVTLFNTWSQLCKS